MIEDEAMQRTRPQLQLDIVEQKLKWNRLMYARMAYLQNVFTEYPNR